MIEDCARPLMALLRWCYHPETLTDEVFGQQYAAPMISLRSTKTRSSYDLNGSRQ